MIISFSKENNVHVRMLHHEYANEADDDDVPMPAQSLGTPVPRQKVITAMIFVQNCCDRNM